jgi:DNA-binding MarR family transcriptional regulator
MLAAVLDLNSREKSFLAYLIEKGEEGITMSIKKLCEVFLCSERTIKRMTGKLAENKFIEKQKLNLKERDHTLTYTLGTAGVEWATEEDTEEDIEPLQLSLSIFAEEEESQERLCGQVWATELSDGANRTSQLSLSIFEKQQEKTVGSAAGQEGDIAPSCACTRAHTPARGDNNIIINNISNTKHQVLTSLNKSYTRGRARAREGQDKFHENSCGKPCGQPLVYCFSVKQMLILCNKILGKSFSMTKEIACWMRAACNRKFGNSLEKWENYLKAVKSSVYLCSEKFNLSLKWLLNFTTVDRILNGEFGVKKAIESKIDLFLNRVISRNF